MIHQKAQNPTIAGPGSVDCGFVSAWFWVLFRFGPLVLVAGTLSRRMIAIRLFFPVHSVVRFLKIFVRFLPPRLTNQTIDNLRNTSQNIGGRKLGSSIFENQCGSASDKLKGKN